MKLLLNDCAGIMRVQAAKQAQHVDIERSSRFSILHGLLLFSLQHETLRCWQKVLSAGCRDFECCVT